MREKVVITGMGAITPLGNDVTSFWEALKAGRSGVGRITRFDPSRLDSKVAAEVKGFEPRDFMEAKEARKMALFAQYAVAAAVQAWRQAGFEGGSFDPERVAVVMGNGIGGLEACTEAHRKLFEAGPGRMPPMTVPLMIGNEASGNIALHLGVKGPAYTQVTACSSGTDALGQALDMIRAGRCDIAIAGGTEAAISEFAMGGFCMLKALSTARNDDPERASRPFDKGRDGFVMGEGAGVLVLERLSSAKARGATVLAELAGYGASCDAYHLTAPDPSGEGGARAIRLAMADAGLGPEDVDYYNAHGTSTQINDPTETLMVKKAFGARAASLPISSTKSMTGHCIAAAGAIEAIACVMAIREGFIPATINLDDPDPACDLDCVPKVGRKVEVRAALSASLGFGGHNGCVAMRRAE